MGSLTKAVLGLVRGKVGNVSFRVRNNVTYAYSIPEKVNVSQTEGAKKARSKFTPLSRFASFIKSIPDLKYFWAKANIKASSAYHKITKYNYPFFLYNRPAIENEIVPRWANSSGMNPIRTSYLDKTGIRMEARYEQGWFVQLEEETFIYALVVISFYNPVKGKSQYFVFNKLEEDNFEIKTEEQFEIKIPFTEGALNNYYLYRNSIIYVTFITRDASGNPVRYSENYKHEFTHEYSDEEKIYIDQLQESELKEKTKEGYKEYLKRIFSRRGKD
ncbi:MAG: hypothetical protein P4L27_01060 [Ignavibacteriaceae bacterium]|nr:hypothetical protein [Ignavibacteriaceae bacterium]